MKRLNIFSRCLLLSLTFLGISNYGFAAVPDTANAFSLAPVLEKAMPAIVNVAVQGELPPIVEGKAQGRDQHARKSLGKPRPRKFSGLGSGVILDPKHGYVITNAHVIKNSKTITVTLHDGRHFKAKLLGSDPSTDVAVLQIKATKLHALQISNSNSVKVGDFVVAIGNPFGLNYYGTNQTATFGIVSALGRSTLSPSGVSSFIQTDAAINPGNSGGALINVKGELIGINTGIIAASRLSGNVGIGLAIPINMAHTVMTQIIKYGSVHRGLMGVFVQHLTPELATAFDLPDTDGALVSQVNSDSPAEKAGLAAGDIIKSINGQKVTEAAQVKNIIGLLRVGSIVKMTIMRNGQSIHMQTKVTDLKNHEEKQQANNPFLFGLALRNFELLDDSSTHSIIKGAQIVAASENSPARRVGLLPGDVIISANKHSVGSIQELEKLASQSKKQLLLHVRRGAGSLFFLIN